MANYFPLIVNAVTGKIEELPVGDNLDLLGSGLINVSNVENFTIGISNLHIPGGQNGNVLTTDGLGNLSWGVGGGGTVASIPPIYWQAPTSGSGQTFSSSVLTQYTSNTDITLFRNGILLENTNYTLAGSSLTINVNLNTGDTVEVIRQFVSSANIGGGTPGGTNTQVQFNNAGNFGASSSFTFNSATNALTAGNAVIANFFVGDGGLLSNISGGGGNLSNGTSNIQILQNSNILMNIGGNANIMNIGSNIVNVATNLTVNGNLRVLSNTISLGAGASQLSQGNYSIAIGYNSGAQSQGANSVAVGTDAGSGSQGDSAVAIGTEAGVQTQGNNAVSIGTSAGKYIQGQNAVAIGFQAGAGTIGNVLTSQGDGAVAVGARAGVINQGSYSIAVGAAAGILNQPDNSIVINATGSNLNATTANSLFVKPIRNSTVPSTNVVVYDPSSGEVTYQNGSLLPLNVTVVNTPTYSVTSTDQVLAVSYNGDVTITLPTSIAVGSQIIVKDILGNQGNRFATPIVVQVGNFGTQLIDGNASFTIQGGYSGYTFTSISATQWIIL